MARPRVLNLTDGFMLAGAETLLTPPAIVCCEAAIEFSSAAWARHLSEIYLAAIRERR